MPEQQVETTNQESTETVDTTETVTEEVSKEAFEKMQRALKEANKEAAQRRKTIEQYEAKEKERRDAELSEVDKANKRAEEAEQKAQRLERESLQRKAAEAAGLPTAFAERIKGSTLEEMQEDAKSLLEAMPKKTAPKLDANNPGSQTAGETDQEKRVRLGMG